jgi:3-oxoacyl-[acyl-carrier-protein] synthase III
MGGPDNGQHTQQNNHRHLPPAVSILSSGFATGSCFVPSEEVDRAFGMSIGKLRHRAGIESVRYASESEDESTLAATALQAAFADANCSSREIDWLLATSETHHDYPSLAARLHSELACREDCAALDIGGACLGFLNALAVAQSLLRSGQARTIAIATADVHSRTLIPGRVAGEFGGLFGDGASAFLLRSGDDSLPLRGAYQLGEFFFGCAAQYASAIRVSDRKDGALAVRFDGDALSRAAISRLELVMAEIERRSGIARADVRGFATHQPNPRLVTLLAKQLHVPSEFFPSIARTCGNLGSSTCGAALHASLRWLSPGHVKTIFLASLGPGLVYGGGWLAAHA